MLIGSDDAQTPGLEPDAETGLDHWVQGLYLQTFEQGGFGSVFRSWEGWLWVAGPAPARSASLPSLDRQIQTAGEARVRLSGQRRQRF